MEEKTQKRGTLTITYKLTDEDGNVIRLAEKEGPCVLPEDLILDEREGFLRTLDAFDEGVNQVEDDVRRSFQEGAYTDGSKKNS